jgi:beta-xylosidase
LVNWELVGHALPRQEPDTLFRKIQHGKGVWAPSIRYHKGVYYIYWGDPDYGFWRVQTTDPTGTWSKPELVMDDPNVGLED